MSAELDSIKAYLDALGIKYKVSDVDTPGVHTPSSYHYRQLALDLVGPDNQAIFDALAPVQSQLAELFYGKASYNVKDGQRTGLILPGQHMTHVHVAVKSGTQLSAGSPSTPTATNVSLGGATDLLSFLRAVFSAQMAIRAIEVIIGMMCIFYGWTLISVVLFLGAGTGAAEKVLKTKDKVLS